jgi:LysR family transcriptional regulator for metE and metH
MTPRSSTAAHRAPPSAHRAPRLEVRDLHLVLALAAAGSTASAASVLHLTQSAVSRALVLAEGKLGVRLFDRAARGLVPTRAGERLVAGAGGLLAQLAELEDQASAPPERPTRVRLVCECYTAYRWLPSALAKLRASLPNLEVTLAIEHGDAPVPALVSGEIDIALLTTSPVRGIVKELPLFSDEIVFLMSSSHRFASRASLTARDLCDDTLITSKTPPEEARWFASRVFGRKKPKLRFLRFPLTEAIVDAARAGMGIAVLSEWMASAYLGGDDLVVRRLSSGPLRRPWRIAFRPEAEDAARRLLGALEGSAPRVYVGRERETRPRSDFVRAAVGDREAIQIVTRLTSRTRAR